MRGRLGSVDPVTRPSPEEEEQNEGEQAVNKPTAHRGGTFLETVYKDGAIAEKELSEQQVLAIDPHGVDFHFDEAFGRICIRKEDDAFLELAMAIPGVGDKNERLLTEMMWQPGRLLTPRQVAPILGMNPNYERQLREAISALLSRLRGGFGEKAEKGKKPSPWYFLSRRRPFSFGWNAARTWRIIERIAEPVSGNGVR
jgi:hypothetical protein